MVIFPFCTKLSYGKLIKTAQAVRSRLSQKSGNILVYIVMIMVIFAVLGVAMVSLFSTSISSSATANDTRRATYLSEAGIRYAASELRAAAFSKTTITALNNTVYTVSGAGRFDLNVFSHWFEPLALIDIGAGGNDTRVVELPEGELATGFYLRHPNVRPASDDRKLRLYRFAQLIGSSPRDYHWCRPSCCRCSAPGWSMTGSRPSAGSRT